MVIGTFWNLHASDAAVGNLQPREEEDVEVIENQYLPIEYHLIVQSPSTKRIGYISSIAPGELAALRWSQLRYVMIPRILMSSADEQYVIVHFKVGEPPPPVPENLVQVFDPGNGLILYKRKTAP